VKNHLGKGRSPAGREGGEWREKQVNDHPSPSGKNQGWPRRGKGKKLLPRLLRSGITSLSNKIFQGCRSRKKGFNYGRVPEKGARPTGNRGRPNGRNITKMRPFRPGAFSKKEDVSL